VAGTLHLLVETRPADLGGYRRMAKERRAEGPAAGLAEARTHRAKKAQGPAQGDAPMSRAGRGGTLGLWPATCSIAATSRTSARWCSPRSRDAYGEISQQLSDLFKKHAGGVGRFSFVQGLEQAAPV